MKTFVHHEFYCSSVLIVFTICTSTSSFQGLSLPESMKCILLNYASALKCARMTGRRIRCSKGPLFSPHPDLSRWGLLRPFSVFYTNLLRTILHHSVPHPPKTALAFTWLFRYRVDWQLVHDRHSLCGAKSTCYRLHYARQYIVYSV